jgi:hypothetical protein
LRVELPNPEVHVNDSLPSTRRRFLGRVAAAVVASVPAGVALARPRAAFGWAICADYVRCQIAGSRCHIGTLELLMACYDGYTGVWCYNRWEGVGPC